jgi:hypothetical protein
MKIRLVPLILVKMVLLAMMKVKHSDVFVRPAIPVLIVNHVNKNKINKINNNYNYYNNYNNLK